MLSIDDYIDHAKKAIGTNSDRELCRRLDLSLVTVGYWRLRKSIPSDESMVKLAQLANMDPAVALGHLNWWRSVSRNETLAATTYKMMLEQYIGTAA